MPAFVPEQQSKPPLISVAQELGDWSNWRPLLQQLAGLPLLPIGANPPDCKTPIDISTGMGLLGWTQSDTSFTPEQIAVMPSCVVAAGVRTGHDGILVLDVDGCDARDWLLARGVDANSLHTWQVWRTTTHDADTHFKLVFRLTAEQQAQLPHDKTKIYFDKRDGQDKRDLLELFWSTGGQVLVLGAHSASGGWYCWRNTPFDITTPDAATFAAILALKAEADYRRSLGGGATNSNGRVSSSSEWRESSARQPCPVCGRRHSGACGIHRSGDVVHCYEGGRNQPPVPPEGWVSGKTVIGFDGRLWAYTKTIETFGEKRVFKIHRPLANSDGNSASVNELWPNRPDLVFPEPDPVIGSGPQGPLPTTIAKPTTAAEKLRCLRAQADLIISNKDIQTTDRLFYMRDYAESVLGLFPRDVELNRHLWEARRRAVGVADIIKPGERLDRTEQPWLWKGIIMLQAANLVVALPKVGKTSLLLEFVRCWLAGFSELFDKPICAPPAPVLIVGTDQPESDWARMLDEADLLVDDGLNPSIIGLATTSRPIHLDSEGIAKIASYSERHPGLLIIVDSYHGCVRSLGLKDKDSDYAEPFMDLQEAVAPFRATVVIVHHAGKTNAKEGAVMASRGGTALPAAVSHLVALTRMAKKDPLGPDDPRIVIKTEGRAGGHHSLLVERTDTGAWICHGTAEEVERQQYLDEVEGNLSDIQEGCLEAVRTRFKQTRSGSTVADVHYDISKGAESSVRRALKKLAKQGLLRCYNASEGVEGPGRRGDVYFPLEASSHNSGGDAPHTTAGDFGPRDVFPVSTPFMPLMLAPSSASERKGIEGVSGIPGKDRETTHETPFHTSPPLSGHAGRTLETIPPMRETPLTPPDTDWHPLAAAIKEANPSWVALQVAIQLKLDHGLDISSPRVRDFLKSIEPTGC